MSEKPRLITIKGVIVSIVLGIISNILYDLLQFFSGGAIFQLQPWITNFAIAFIASFSTYILFKKRDEPIFELSADLKEQIDDFNKYFNHPYNGLVQNPFDKSPEFWDSFYEISHAFLTSSIMNLTNNLKKSRKDLNLEELESYSFDFCRIVNNYLKIAGIFRKMTKKYQLSAGIKEQYNEKFVTEFNTLTRPNLIRYLEKLEKTSKKEYGINKNIETVAFI